eukprot:scaffold14757_cov111-Isochrysis_galbana.AAC.6
MPAPPVDPPAASHLVFQIELLKVVALLARAVAADRRDVEHALTKLDEGAALDRNVEVGEIGQHPVDEPFQRCLACASRAGRPAWCAAAARLADAARHRIYARISPR